MLVAFDLSNFDFFLNTMSDLQGDINKVVGTPRSGLMDLLTIPPSQAPVVRVPHLLDGPI